MTARKLPTITLLIALVASASGCLTYAVGADKPTRNGYTIAISAEVAAIVVYGSYLAASGENPDNASSSNQLGAGLGVAALVVPILDLSAAGVTWLWTRVR